ncbi:MAG: ABC transporter ATP-binding protein [Syntrophomonadaceae bacterium]|nr:ABC transporter ATP-binding protein [Syntrophomonadaceae bacterium]MDD4550169.1 ABC transporter ATP-binding protein [Syntrophomonadaceae bacterium]
MEPAIQIQELSKAFDDNQVIDKLSLQVPQGSIFGLVGPNGAGKSTLMQILMGIIHPDSGDAFILGKSIKEKTGNIRKQVAYVPDVPIMYPSFTVQDMFLLGSKLYPNWDRKRCQELNDAFALPLTKRIRSLSRGMQVRTALVMALALRPRLIILDEPTAVLDPVARHGFLQAIINEVAAAETTIFYSTHNLSDLEQAADHIAALNHGKLLFTHAIDELKESIHRLQVVFADSQLPVEIALLPGIIARQSSGKIHTLTITGSLDEIKNQIKIFNPVLLEPVNLNLEDIFITIMKQQGYTFELPVDNTPANKPDKEES